MENEIKIRVAFIKFGGMSAGGTEKFLQTIAANLDPTRFEVDYYYCDTAPYTGSNYRHAGTDIHRLKYMQDRGVNLIEFSVEALDNKSRHYNWLGTNFWQLFDETRYDIIQAGRFGKPTYPFTKIKKTPIVDSLHILAGVDNQFNISRVMHITNWSAKKWIRQGGDSSRVVIVSHPMEIVHDGSNLREILKCGDKFIYGFHQRNDESIFSNIPLEAYKKIENDSTLFIMLGGGETYRKQAQDLGIKNIKFLDHTGDSQMIYRFLSTLNVYSHGRKDGEVNSTAMAEAMFFGLPIVSHISKFNNGHIECIAESGKVLDTVDEYAAELKKLQIDIEYYKYRSNKSLGRFQEMYELKNQIKHIEEIYEDVARNPFPNKWHRYFSTLRLQYVFLYTFVRIVNKLKRKFINR